MLNLKILGHPVNIALVVLVVALFWFALYSLRKTGVVSDHADGSAAANS